MKVVPTYLSCSAEYSSVSESSESLLYSAPRPPHISPRCASSPAAFPYPVYLTNRATGNTWGLVSTTTIVCSIAFVCVRSFSCLSPSLPGTNPLSDCPALPRPPIPLHPGHVPPPLYHSTSFAHRFPCRARTGDLLTGPSPLSPGSSVTYTACEEKQRSSSIRHRTLLNEASFASFETLEFGRTGTSCGRWCERELCRSSVRDGKCPLDDQHVRTHASATSRALPECVAQPRKTLSCDPHLFLNVFPSDGSFFTSSFMYGRICNETSLSPAVHTGCMKLTHCKLLVHYADTIRYEQLCACACTYTQLGHTIHLKAT